jgi:hypothetical protein
MTFTEEEKNAYEIIVRELYGKRIELQPCIESLEIELVNADALDLYIPFVFAGTITIGMKTAGYISDVNLILDGTSTIKMQTLSYEYSSFQIAPIEVTSIFNRITIATIAITQTVFWGIRGYKGFIR